jgi:hypothetical protein
LDGCARADVSVSDRPVAYRGANRCGVRPHVIPPTNGIELFAWLDPLRHHPSTFVVLLADRGL